MASNRKTPVQKREDFEDTQQHAAKHLPVVSNALKIKLEHIRTIEPLTDNQGKFFDAYRNGGEAFVLAGSAGSGKSHIGLYLALKDVLTKETPYKKVIIVRSSVSVRSPGHLPGSVNEKFAIYELPYKQICAELFGRKDAYDRLVEQGYIEFVSTSFLRGLTFNDSIVFADEQQNSNWSELFTLCSRHGIRSKLILCGDSKQNDLLYHRNDQSGFDDFMKVAENMKEFSIIKFTTDDIIRSGFCKNFIIACEKLGF